MNQVQQERSRSFTQSLQNAARGIFVLVSSERNFRIHLVIAVGVSLCAACLGFSVLNWIVMLLTISTVLLAEAFNSAIESLVDLVEPEKHPLAGRAKDIAAAAVLIASIFSVMIGVLLFGPPLLAVFNQIMN